MFEKIVMDFAWTAFLLLIGTFLRAKAALVQRLYIPAAVVGGFAGLLLGPQILGRFAPFCIQWSEYVHQYSVLLLAILFSVQFFGVKLEKKMIKRASSVWMIATVVIGAQVLSAGLTANLFQLPDGFALLTQAGLFGGHGTPEIYGTTWGMMEYWSRDEISALGNAFATIGLLFATIGGIFLINIVEKRGWLTHEKGHSDSLSQEEKTGYIEPGHRVRFMEKTVMEHSLDPLAFHIAIVLTMLLCTQGLLKLIHLCALRIPALHVLINLNAMPAALITGLIFSRIAGRTRLGQICDIPSMKRVGGTALEFVVALSIATTDLSIVKQYALPILAASVLGLLLTVVLCLGLSRLWIRKNWFEHGILMMGAYTGVLATGLMLLRIVDPENRTDASTDVIAASPLWILSGQNYYISVAPLMIVTAAGYMRVMKISWIFAVGGIVLGFLLFRCRAEK